MFPGEAKAGIKTAGSVRTPHTLTMLASISEGQTREITGCEHYRQNADSLILVGDTEAGMDIKVGVNLVCASDAQTPLGLSHKVLEWYCGWHTSLYLHGLQVMLMMFI